jgi:hypothetical protein
MDILIGSRNAKTPRLAGPGGGTSLMWFGAGAGLM